MSSFRLTLVRRNGLSLPSPGRRANHRVVPFVVALAAVAAGVGSIGCGAPGAEKPPYENAFGPPMCGRWPCAPPSPPLVLPHPGTSSSAPALAPSGPPPQPETAPSPKPRGLARGDGTPTDALLKEGDKAYESADFEAAEKIYRKASSLSPKDAAPVVGVARARLAKDAVPVDFNSAPNNPTLRGMATELVRATKLDPTYAPAALELGRALLVMGKTDDALKALRRAVDLDGSDPESHSALGVGLLATGDVPGATKELGRAAEIEPASAERQGNFGTALLMAGRVDEAVNAFGKALKIAPNDPRILNDLGTTMLQQNQVDNGIALLEKAVQLEPKRATYKNNLGYGHWLKSELDRAMSLYQEALALDDKLVSAWINLGNAHARLKQYREARGAYDRAKEIDPTDPRVKAAIIELEGIEKGTSPAPTPSPQKKPPPAK